MKEKQKPYHTGSPRLEADYKRKDPFIPTKYLGFLQLLSYYSDEQLLPASQVIRIVRTEFEFLITEDEAKHIQAALISSLRKYTEQVGKVDSFTPSLLRFVVSALDGSERLVSFREKFYGKNNTLEQLVVVLLREMELVLNGKLDSFDNHEYLKEAVDAFVPTTSERQKEELALWLAGVYEKFEISLDANSAEYLGLRLEEDTKLVAQMLFEENDLEIQHVESLLVRLISETVSQLDLDGILPNREYWNMLSSLQKEEIVKAFVERRGAQMQQELEDAKYALQELDELEESTLQMLEFFSGVKHRRYWEWWIASGSSIFVLLLVIQYVSSMIPIFGVAELSFTICLSLVLGLSVLGLNREWLYNAHYYQLQEYLQDWGYDKDYGKVEVQEQEAFEVLADFFAALKLYDYRTKMAILQNFNFEAASQEVDTHYRLVDDVEESGANFASEDEDFSEANQGEI